MTTKVTLIPLKRRLFDIPEDDFEILAKEFRWQGVSEELIEVIHVSILNVV